MQGVPAALRITALSLLVFAPGRALAADDAASRPTPVPPTLVKFVPAVYPESAVEAGLTAEVILDISIDAAGAVTTVAVHTPSEHPELGFEEAARDAAKGFVFDPATLEGRPIPARILYRYRFTLEKKVPETGPASRPTSHGDDGDGDDDDDDPPLDAGSVSPSGTEPGPINFSGRVREKGTREPIAGAVLLIPGLGLEAESDDRGAFEIRGLPTGEHEVRIAAPGYETLTSRETIRPGERTVVTYYIRTAPATEWRTTIRADRETKEVSRYSLDEEEFSMIPGTGGEPIRAIAALPGVSRGPFGSGLLVIRGSAPEDTRFFVMGHDIPLPFHFGGVATSFNPRLVKRLDFFPGGFGPQWGSATGGIIDLEPRDASRDGYHGVLEVDLFDAGALVEGPIGKKVAFAAAFRRSYIDAILPAVIPDNDVLSFVAAPSYFDWQAMLDVEATGRDTIKILLFGSDERLKLLLDSPSVPDPSIRGELKGATSFQRLSARWRHRHDDGMFSELSMAGGPSRVDVAVGEDLFLDLRNLDASLRYQLTLPVTERLDITVGTRLTFERISVNVRAPRPPANGGIIAPIGGSDLLVDEEVRFVVDSAIYFEAKWRPTDAIQIVPGLRLDYFGLVRNATVDPRLLVRWRVNDYLTLKTAAGIYHKAPEPQELSASFGNPLMGPEQAVHLVMGGEVALPIGVMIDVTVFYKWLDDLVLSEPAGESLAAVTTNAGAGQALGLEVMIKFRPTPWLMGWVSYTVSRSSRTLYYDDELVVRPFQYDHTHVVTALARVDFGKGWSLGVRWNLSSGAPYSRSPGGYYDVDADLYGPLGGDPNAERIPAFHTLDIRIDKKFTFNWLTLELYLEVMNAYNRSNREQPLYSFDYREQDFFRGLPIIPSFGIAGKF